MTVAFVLLNTDLGAEQEVILKMNGIKGVTETHFLYGVYDIISKVEAATTDGVKEIMHRIRDLEQVKSTLTMIVVGDS